eukprot:scaffold234640_cov24-Tisochrysis_lutea.AAC.3
MDKQVAIVKHRCAAGALPPPLAGTLSRDAAPPPPVPAGVGVPSWRARPPRQRRPIRPSGRRSTTSGSRS